MISLVLIAVVGFGPTSGCNPEVFHYGDLCALDPASNIVDMQPHLDNEVQCQNQCVQDPLCNHWMFQRSTTGRTSCFLLQECNITGTSCADSPDCEMAILGPKTPTLSFGCCIDFDFGYCDPEFEIDRFSNVANRAECQHLCRATTDCTWWTLYDDICFLYTECRGPGSGIACPYYSGPVFPDISACDVYSDENEPCSP